MPIFRTRKQKRRSSVARGGRRRRVVLEQLESRRLLATITVTDGFDGPLETSAGDGLISLREAIEAANTDTSVDGSTAGEGADTIKFAPNLRNTIHLGLLRGQSPNDLDNKALRCDDIFGRGVPCEFESVPNFVISSPLTIDGDSAGVFGMEIRSTQSRVFDIDDGDDATEVAVEIKNLRLRGTGSVDGGAVRSRENLVLRDVVIANSLASRGGGIYAAGTTTIIGSEIFDNESFSGGGGIWNTGEMAIKDSQIFNNEAGGSGNGRNVNDRNEGTVGEGGGIFNTGGGAANRGHSALTVTNSVLYDNRAGGLSFGGGIYHGPGTFLTVVNSTLSENKAFGRSFGSIHIDDGAEPALLHNTIVVTNSGSGRTIPDIIGQLDPSSSNNLISDGTGSNLVHDVDGNPATGNNNIVGGSGGQPIIEATRSDLELFYQPVFGHRLELAPNSRAIDAGNNALAVDPGPDLIFGTTDDTPLQFDLRGAPLDRIFDGGTGTATVDIGAFESQPFNNFESQRFNTGLIVNTLDDELDPSDPSISLREAINKANQDAGPDTIRFDRSLIVDGSATITLTLGELSITDSLTIDGLGRDLLKIDANALSRVLSVPEGSADLTLQNLTITGGRTTEAGREAEATTGGDGGGIRFESSGLLKLENTKITGNSTLGDDADGGAIYSRFGNVTAIASEITGNSTAGFDSQGGAIHFQDGTLTIARSTLSGNSTVGDDSDGGALSSESNVEIIDSIISDNSTAGDDAFGGGIVSFDANLTIQRSTISGNSTSGTEAQGGGIYFDSGDADSASLTITASTISGNRAKGPMSYGGGINTNTNLSGQTATITNSTISGNTSASIGGGIYNGDGLMFIRNSTITLNEAPVDFGGGVASYGDANTETRIASSIVAGNTGSDVDIFSGEINSFLSTGFNLIGAGSGLASFTAVGDTINVVDPLLEPLDNVGGVTKTHAPMSGSPAVNQGNPAFDTSTILTDQRGSAFERVADGRIDIGAFEQQSFDTSQFGVTTLRDELDFTNDLVSLREAIELANGDLQAELIEILIPGTITLELGPLVITDDLTIVGVPNFRLSENATTIDGDERSRVFDIQAGDVTLDSLVITGGLTTDDLEHGAGIRNLSTGTVVISNSAVQGNRTTGVGGLGAGIYSDSGDLTIIRTTVDQNRTEGVLSSGGGILFSGGNLTVDSSTISGNSTMDRGGGIASLTNLTDETVSIVNSTISGNMANGQGGGGIANVIGKIVIRHSTITANVASAGNGSGVASNGTAGTTTIVESSIIAGNVNSDVDVINGVTETFSSLGHNLIGTGSQLASFGGTGDQMIGAADPMLGELTDSGGPTKTHALLNGSRAIDNGSPAFEQSTLSSDQRGIQFQRVFDGTIDIGAYERQSLDSSLFVVTTLADEPVATNTDVSLREAIASTLDHALIVIAEGGSPQSAAATISFADGLTGTIDLNSELQIRALAPLVIEGPGSDLLTIDANQRSRVMSISLDALSGADVTLRGFTITGGDTGGLDSEADDSLLETDGGGISASVALAGFIDIPYYFTSIINLAKEPGEDQFNTLRLEDVTVQGNTATSGSGGGIVSNVNLELVDSSVLDNTTTGDSLSLIDNRFNSDPGTSGGGIRAFGTLDISNSTISGNSTDGRGALGGGIASTGLVTSISGSSITNNRTLGDAAPGGGIIVSSFGLTIGESTITENSTRSLTIGNSTISGNSTAGDDSDGGGIAMLGGSLAAISGSTISGNSTTGDGSAGGGIWSNVGDTQIMDFSNSGTTITDTTVSGNTTAGGANSVGGGIASVGNLAVLRSTISGNTTGDLLVGGNNGGGIYSTGNLLIADSTISGNRASHGGGVFMNGYDSTIVRSTITGNMASDGGGGGVVQYSGSTTFVQSSIIAGNFNDSLSVPTLDNVVVLRFPEDDALRLFVSLGYNLIGRADRSTVIFLDAAGFALAEGDQIIVTDPMLATGALNEIIVTDPILGPLANNGGQTQTHALLPGSPAIDAGDPSAELNQNLREFPEFDQRGDPFARVIDGDGEGTATIDIGAFEFVFNNTTPRIATLADQTVLINTSTEPLSVVVEDDQTASNELIITAVSSDQNLLPNGNLSIVDTGSGRTITAIPASDQTGTATITVTVTDPGGLAAMETFTFAVNDAPPTTIEVDGSDDTFSLRNTNLSLDGVDTIDLRGAGDNTLELDAEVIRTRFAGGVLNVVANSGDNVVFDEGWSFETTMISDGQLVRQFVHSGAILNLIGPDDFTNPMDRFDVNANGDITAVDALQIINELNNRAFGTSQSNPPGSVSDITTVNLAFFGFYDVSRDFSITALDALQVINELNRQGSANLEPSDQLVFSLVEPSRRDEGTNKFDETALTLADLLVPDKVASARPIHASATDAALTNEIDSVVVDRIQINNSLETVIELLSHHRNR